MKEIEKAKYRQDLIGELRGMKESADDPTGCTQLPEEAKWIQPAIDWLEEKRQGTRT